MKTRRITSYELPMLDRFTVDVEAVAWECPACGQPRRRDGRCVSRDCELRNSRVVESLIDQYERSQEG